MVGFNFDEKKGAQENIKDFLSYVESIDRTFGQLLRRHLDKMLPLPEASKRSAARVSFNGEIKKLLDAAIASGEAKKHA